MIDFPKVSAILAIGPTYGRLNEKGLCDAPGGTEHFRIAREWDRAGRPDDIEAFVIERANAEISA